MRHAFAFIATAALLAACAAMPGAVPAGQEYAQLKQACDAKGGILVTIPEANSHTDRANYACDIKSGARLSRRP